MDQQIAKVSQSLCTAENMRNDTKLLMQPHANWEEYLTPAPLSIAIMAELVFISSNTDFSINKNPPKGGYKFIRYPDSFRASLMQVCNSGWHAFNEAHTSMDQIRLHTLVIPDYMKEVVKILFQDNDQIVKTLLPCQLERISDISEECSELSASTEKKFTEVINLIQELLEACVNSKHCYGEEMEEIKTKIEESKLREQAATESKKRAEKAAGNLSKQLDDTQNNFNKAMNSIPSGWERVGLEVTGALLEGVTTIVNAITFKNLMQNVKDLSGTVKEVLKKKSNRSKDQGDPFAAMKILSMSKQLLTLTENMRSWVNGKEIQWATLYDQRSDIKTTDKYLTFFQGISDSVRGEAECIPKEKALCICDKGERICSLLGQFVIQRQCDISTTKRVIEDITHLHVLALKFDAQSKAATNTPAFTSNGPCYAKQAQKSAGTSLGSRVADDARFKVEQTRIQMEKTRELYEKSVENMEKNEKELTEILVTLNSCNIKEIDFNTTIQMLVKGMDAMGRVKEQWEKMVRFFQMVSNLIKTSLCSRLTDFVKQSEAVQKLDYNGKQFSRDMLYTLVFKASDVASLVHMISGAYTEVSTKYLMDRVSSLGKLMAMDPTKPEFEKERILLQENCQAAQKGILNIVRKNKRDFERNTMQRLENIESSLNAILPPATPQSTKMIQSALMEGCEEEDMSAYI
ncbi:uncharacterized protein FYW47_015120 [Aplochiton taeniatus]